MGGLITLVVLTSVIIVRLPELVGAVRVTQSLALAVFGVCLAWAVPQPRTPVRPGAAALAGAFALLVGVSLVRGSAAGVYNSMLSSVVEGLLYLALVAFGALAVATARDDAERRTRLLALALAPVLYVTVNLIGHVAGLHPAAGPDPTLTGSSGDLSASLLARLGVGVNRVLFPFASSVNLFGIVAAAGVVAAAVLALRRAPVSRWVLLGGGLASLAALLLCDSHGPMVVALAVILYFAIDRRARGATGAVALLPFLPLLVVLGLSVLDASGASSLFSRSGTGTDFSTATGRTFVWQVAYGVFAHPHLQHLIGWGAFGQTSSGASLHWAYEFRGVVSDPTTANTHDLVLQTLFDTGWIGLVALVLAAGSTFVSLARWARRDDGAAPTALLAVLLMLLLSGATEASPTYLAQEALVLTLLTMGAAAALPRDAGAG